MVVTRFQPALEMLQIHFIQCGHGNDVSCVSVYVRCKQHLGSRLVGGGGGGVGGGVGGGGGGPVGGGGGGGAQAEIAKELGDEVGGGAVEEVGVELGGVDAVDELGAQGVGVGGAGFGLDGILDLAEKAGAGGGAALCGGQGCRGGGTVGDLLGDVPGDEDGAAGGSADALEGFGSVGDGVGWGLGDFLG